MKNRLIVLLLIAASWQSSAQDYTPMLDTTNNWYCAQIMEFGDVSISMLKLGDTVSYDDTLYYELIDFQPESKLKTIQGFLYEDTIEKKVYANYSIGKYGNEILCDFSLEEGDSIFLVFHESWYYVDSIRDYQTNVDIRKAWYLHSQWGEGYEPIWVEGIGSLAGILKPGKTPTLWYWGWGELNCFYNQDELVYQSDMAAQYGCMFEYLDIQDQEDQNIFIYPNPVTDKLTIKISNLSPENLYIEIYNITGEKVIQKQINNNTFDVFTGKFQKGIYLINIKQNNSSIFITKFIKH